MINLTPVTWVLLTVVASVCYVLGCLTGVFLLSDDEAILSRGHIRKLMMLLVMGVWTMSNIASVLVDGYTTSALLHGIMGSVVGFLVAEEDLSIGIGR
jgi:uncharacterized membrane protein